MGSRIGTSLKQLAMFAGAAVVAVTLSGCGFTPLYGKSGVSSSPEVVDAMATVAIRPLPDRQGMKLRQVLREGLQPTGLTRAVYDLDVNFAQRIEELGIRPDATSSRANMVMSATFSLYEKGQRVFGDRVQSTVSYNILDDQYATVASQADAENRGIRQIGEEIRTRLAVYFHERAKTTNTAAAVKN
jgi:LPS-assembly lipoprotein